MDGQRRAKNIHWGSGRCHCASRYVLEAEAYALVCASDNRYIVPKALAEILGRTVKLKAFVDSRMLFNVIAKKIDTAEKMHSLLEKFSGEKCEKRRMDSR